MAARPGMVHRCVAAAVEPRRNEAGFFDVSQASRRRAAANTAGCQTVDEVADHGAHGARTLRYPVAEARTDRTTTTRCSPIRSASWKLLKY